MNFQLAHGSGRRALARVLVVDDDPHFGAALADLLEATGCEVRTAKDGLEAVEVLLDHGFDFDIVFMDYQMPELDGCEATRRIREREIATARRVTVIACSAAPDPRKFFESGMDDCLPKPPTRRDLERILARWLARRKVQSANGRDRPVPGTRMPTRSAPSRK